MENDDTEPTLGDRIKHYREKAGLSKRRMARAIGITDVSIHYWENGTISEIGHLKLKALAELFEITVSELVHDPRLVAYNNRMIGDHRTAIDNAYRQGQQESTMAAAAMAARVCERTAREILGMAGIMSGDDLTACSVDAIQMLLDAGIKLPRLREVRDEAGQRHDRA